MGITGLLQFIKDASEPINIKKYKGQTMAVDTYCWLHKGAFSCAEKLAKGEPTEQYVWYCMKFVDMLLGFKIKPILVFDGRNLPSKHEVEKNRRERREANLQKGRQLLREGKVSEARDCFTRCVNITPAMAHNVIKAARVRGVDCIVAPYEADAQLAYLTKSGLAQAVITEDSDLLAFGCKKVILKMDKHGNGLEIDQSNFGRCRSLGNVFTEEKFRYMCILSGCDYLPSLPGIGLGKACKLLRLAKDPDIIKVIRKISQYLKINLSVPEEYIEGFIRANNTFLYQLVFDPVRRKVVPLNTYPEHTDVSTLNYAGLKLGDDKDLQMAMGNLDLNNLERIDDFDPDKAISQPTKTRSWSDTAPTGSSIWSRDFKPVCQSASQPSDAASPNTSPCSSGKERVTCMDSVRPPCRELQVKRPREDNCMSDQDLLQQYVTSSQKRSKSNQLPDTINLVRKPRPGGPFATLLHKRNVEAEEDCQATCSRYFSSCSPAVKSTVPAQHLEHKGESPTQSNSTTSSPDSNGPCVPLVNSSTPPPAQSSASQDIGLFHWSPKSTLTEPSLRTGSTLGQVGLQQFKYKKSFSPPTKTLISPGEISPSVSPITEVSTHLNGDLPESLRFQDNACVPHSEPSIPRQKSPTSTLSTSHRQDAASEMVSNRYLMPEHNSTHATRIEKKPGMPKSKVLGLSVKSSHQQQAAKVKTLGQARVSGLRKKSVYQEKLSTINNENKPKLQATISNLWKNFSFKTNAQTM